MSTEIEIRPEQNLRLATDVAGLTKDIVSKSAVQIQGKKYIPVEGWEAIAVAHGVALSSCDVSREYDRDGNFIGYSATGQAINIASGLVMGHAKGFVGFDECDSKGKPTWRNRPEYAGRAMAQTRAISRVGRALFAHVVVMMNAGLSTTPADEVPDGGFTEAEVVPQSENPHAELEDMGVVLGEEIPKNAWNAKDKLDALLSQAGMKRTQIKGKWMVEKI